jgi:hypothetical protein
MKPHRHGPAQVSLEVHGEVRTVEPIEISGHRAALRLDRAVETDAPASLTLSWNCGARTRLAASVRSVSRRREDLHVAHVDVLGVDGDWKPFLEYLGAA